MFCYLLKDTTQTVPVVVKCVREMVTKSTNSLLVHLVSMVLSWQATDESKGTLIKEYVPESIMAKIPKDWNIKILEGRRKDTASRSRHKLLSHL